jgi:hypothetical protein
MQINPNSSNRFYLLKLASHEIEPTLERLNELDWKQVGKTLPNSDEYVHLSNRKRFLQQEADKIAEAKQAEALKQANMNPLYRPLYKAVVRPIGNIINTFKKEPEEVPFVHDTSGGTNWFNN